MMKTPFPYQLPVHDAVFAVHMLSFRHPIPQEIPPLSFFILVSGQGVIQRTWERPGIAWEKSSLPEICAAGQLEYLGHRGETSWYSIAIPEGSVVPGGQIITHLRDLFGQIPDEDLALASYAVRISGSAESSRFCGRCGHTTERVRTERAWRCPACGLVAYPRISPAIIVLIQKGEEILLARSPRFPPEMYSVIAGFAEPGETLEHAVCREVQEEVGISVKNICYFASEPWPFPDSLMIAFTAEYDAGEITIDNNEIIAAGWYRRDNLPALPAPMSISRSLIDRWRKRDAPDR